MKKTVTLLIDDLDGSEATRTTRFTLDGTEYEIDLSADNHSALEAAMAPFREAARVVRKRIGRPKKDG